MFHQDPQLRYVYPHTYHKKGEPVRPYPSSAARAELERATSYRAAQLSGQIERDNIAVLLTVPTGVVAFNIQGMTLHSALVLGTTNAGCQPLAQDKLNTLRTKLSHLQLLIIDKDSMVPGGVRHVADTHASAAAERC